MPKLVRFGTRVLRDFFLRNHGLLLTGAVAYNMMFSLIPLCAVMIVAFSHFFEPRLLIESMSSEVALLAPGFVPTLTEVLEGFINHRQVVGWTGVVVLLFFSSLAFRVLEDAFAIIFHRPLPTLKRRFWVSAMMPYLFILIVAAGLIAITSINALLELRGGILAKFPQLNEAIQRIGGPLIYVTGLLMLVLLFTLLYKIMPVAKVRFHRALAGGLTAAALWEITRHVLIAYYTRVSIVNVVYGSIATVIIVLVTMEIVALILLLGAQVIADLQRNANLGIPWHEDPEKLPGVVAEPETVGFPRFD
ncbi:MAG: YihY/virulence factor BrkB family protein [Verrucomicrobia bacterium]|nr:YihY/virulence factor BrkB family protein [Verrucomicrobiota bacterium]